MDSGELEKIKKIIPRMIKSSYLTRRDQKKKRLDGKEPPTRLI